MTKNLIYLLVFAFGFTFVSCNKDNGNDNEGDSGVTVNTLSAKWEISDSNSPYASFEFNKDGNYIVVRNVETNLRSSSVISKVSLLKNNSLKAAKTRSSESENLSPVLFGTYRIEGNKIILSGFGVIEVISITSEKLSFSFTLESTGEKISFVAEKSEEPISSSSRTDMLCRTWNFDRLTIDFDSFSQEDIDDYKEEYGENWKNKLEQREKEYMQGLTVLFSRAGTYLVSYGGERAGETGLAEWKWANSQETKLYYSWDNWEYDWKDNIVTITDLKSTSLAIQEEVVTWYFRLNK